MTSKKKHIYITLMGLSVALVAVYFVFLREYIASIYYEKSAIWVQDIVNTLYPRFKVEKHRFDISFFQNKADQVVIRSIIVILIYGLWEWKRENVKLYFNTTTNLFNAKFLIKLFCIGTICYTLDWYIILKEYGNISSFYKPILWYQIISTTFPNNLLLLTVYITMIVGLLMTLLGIFPKKGILVSLLSFLYLQGLFYCFEKTDHRYVTLSYSFILMPFFITQSSQTKDGIVNAWPLQLIKVLIVSIYFVSGLEKLISSNLLWLSSETLESYITIHQTKAGLFILNIPFVKHLLPPLVIIMQLGFVGILFFPKHRIFFLSLGISFHFGTVLLLNVGDFLTPWIFTYIFFIDWNFLEKYFNSGLLAKISNQIKGRKITL